MANSELHAKSYAIASDSWRKIASAPPGGTVIGLAADAGGWPWLASPAGLFRRSDQAWALVSEGLPFSEVNAVHAVGRSLFVAGLPDGVAYTVDSGQRWFAARIDQTGQPVTCFTSSPHFNRDGVVLAGTHGSGILRSTDGGRYWTLSNFGLRHFEVFALLSAPDWSQHEQLFAATEGGVYESPNGGRAWRPVGEALYNRAVLCLAVLPQADHPSRAGGLLFAGSESDGLFCSADGGHTWQPIDLGGNPGPVNSLCVQRDGIVLAGTSDLGLLRSVDGGRSWQSVGPQGAVALSLAAVNGILYAGLHESGLLTSTDGGQTWQAEQALAVRRFMLLGHDPAGGWLAGGPTAGLWQLPETENAWKTAPGWPGTSPLYALAASREQVLAASLDGVWRRQPDAESWTQVLQTESGINLLAAAGELAWAGHVAGGLWRSTDRGTTWQPLPPTFQGQALLALGLSPLFEQDQTLLAASADPARQEVTFWRSQDGGLTWQAWFKENTRWYAIQLALAGQQAVGSSFGFGLTVLTQTHQGLRRVEISEPQAPISALLALPDSPVRIAAAGRSLLATLDGQEWQPFNTGLPEHLVIGSLALSPEFDLDGQVVALTLTGDLWGRKVLSALDDL